MHTEKTIAEFIATEQQNQYPLYPDQLSALQIVLEHHDRPVAPLAEQIARRILEANRLYEENPKAKIKYSYGRLWRVIADAIRQLTSQVDRLVELVVALTQVNDPTGFMAFNQDFNEHWNEFAMGFTEPEQSDPQRVAIRQAWININTFNAKLSTTGVPRLDQRLRSAHVFRIALEETPWSDEQDSGVNPDALPTSDHGESESIGKLNYWAPAAATWIINDGKGIFELKEAMIGDDYENYTPTNWKGAKGFSKERFHYWRERFEWITQTIALDEDTRKDASDAAKRMKQIESEAV